jgi:hypothetical protein
MRSLSAHLTNKSASARPSAGQTALRWGPMEEELRSREERKIPGQSSTPVAGQSWMHVDSLQHCQRGHERGHSLIAFEIQLPVYAFGRNKSIADWHERPADGFAIL